MIIKSSGLLNNKICICGTSFSTIKENKFLYCSFCYQTFKEELKYFFESKNLDSIYSLEKNTFKYFVLNLKKDKLLWHRYLDFKKLLENLKNNNIILSEIQDINQINFFSHDWEYSIRIRIARNIHKIVYNIDTKLKSLLSYIFLHKNLFIIDLLKEKYNIILPDNEDLNQFLQEQKIMSSVKIFGDNIKYLILYFVQKEKQTLKILSRIYIGDEDHIRYDFIFFFNDFNNNLWLTIYELVDIILYIYQIIFYIDENLYWQVSLENGFLTKCPTNCGSGIRFYIRLKLNEKNRENFLHFFQQKYIFNRLRNYTIRGQEGEGTKIRDYITLGWDLPYLNIKFFEEELKKKLIKWFYEILSFTKI